MSRVRRRGAESFSLSFLDCICCGFGAIILLLVLTKIGEPIALEEARVDLDSLVALLEEELFEIRGETPVLRRELKSREEQLSEETRNIARLQGDMSSVQGEFHASRQHSEVSEAIEGRLLAAQQELTEEMKRLQPDFRKPEEDAIYLFGDDFSGNETIDEVVATVDRLNVKDAAGNGLVRIHAIGFPVQIGQILGATSGARFANLMRVLCEQNDGTFVGLNRIN